MLSFPLGGSVQHYACVCRSAVCLFLGVRWREDAHVPSKHFFGAGIISDKGSGLFFPSTPEHTPTVSAYFVILLFAVFFFFIFLGSILLKRCLLCCQGRFSRGGGRATGRQRRSLRQEVVIRESKVIIKCGPRASPAQHTEW